MVHPIWNDYPAIREGLVEVKRIMKEDIRLVHPQVKAKVHAYLDAPGKYIRAGLTLLLAQALDGKITKDKLYFAAGIEILHLATLIHDDVIDGAASRRGISTMHETLSNRIAIYAGDYLLAYSGRLMARGQELFGEPEGIYKNPIDQRILERILAGELEQLLNQYNSTMTMKAYLKQIKGKTAFLFGLACQLGAYSIPVDYKKMRRAFQAGQAIGMAFQLSDDLLDYQVSANQLGKPAMQDIQNGIYTAPLLLAIQEDASIADLIFNQNQESWPDEKLVEIQARLEATQSFTRTQAIIASYLTKATNQLMNLEANIDIANFLEGVMLRQF